MNALRSFRETTEVFLAFNSKSDFYFIGKIFRLVFKGIIVVLVFIDYI